MIPAIERTTVVECVPAAAEKPLIAKAAEALHSRRLPWRLRWLKYIQLTKPIQSARVLTAHLWDAPEFPSLLLQVHGPRFLKEAVEASRAVGMKPFLAFGTLLGHHRDGSFIKHDADIDFGLLPEDFGKIKALVQRMTRMGYTIRLYDDHEVSFYREHFPTLLVDFFLFYRKGDSFAYYDCRGETQFEFSFPAEVFERMTEVKFLGRIDTLVPKGVEKFLETSYGDWRTPKKDFNNVHDHPNVTVMDKNQSDSTQDVA